jgi:hypothetical protein
MAKYIKNAWNKLQYKAFQATYDPAANQYVKDEARTAKMSPNALAWDEYKRMWGTRAVDSGLIDKKYFKTYASILNARVPPDNEAIYNASVDTLANSIATWYVNAKYKGDLFQLRNEIEETKPRWQGERVDASGRPIARKPPPKPKTIMQLFMTGFMSTFFSILAFVLIFFVCILAGSLAANDAIGRSATIRVLYFLYAAFPIFTPFVLGYYIYRYFKGTYPLYYNMLPLTTSPGTSWIIQTLKWPFYYVPDKNSAFQAEQFIRLGKALVFGGVPSLPKPPANTLNKPVLSPSAPPANNAHPEPSAPPANNAHPEPSAPPANMPNKPVLPSAPPANNAQPEPSAPPANMPNKPVLPPSAPPANMPNKPVLPPSAPPANMPNKPVLPPSAPPANMPNKPVLPANNNDPQPQPKPPTNAQL